MAPIVWTLLASAVAATPAALLAERQQNKPDYATVNFYWDTDCTQLAGTEFPANNEVQPGPPGVASMQWVQITCTSILCTRDPTTFVCPDDQCREIAILGIGQCATYPTGVWAFWQREGADEAVPRGVDAEGGH